VQINRPTHVSGFLLLVGSQSRNLHWGEVLIVERVADARRGGTWSSSVDRCGSGLNGTSRE
jgi:hypothetical protein